MKKAFWNLLALGSLLTISSLGLAEPAPTSKADVSPKIVVRVHNYAQVSRATLAQAGRTATAIFHKAGIYTVWFDCSLPRADRHPVCSQPRDSAEVDLRILAGKETTRATFAVPRSTCGFALRPMEDEANTLATVFYDCVKRTARIIHVPRDLILGHTMAHEIGHMLLPLGGHSPTGIMRANLLQEDWEHAARGKLVFTSQQAEQLRAHVLERTQE